MFWSICLTLTIPVVVLHASDFVGKYFINLFVGFVVTEQVVIRFLVNESKVAPIEGGGREESLVTMLPIPDI